jgi:hypothetical protein
MNGESQIIAELGAHFWRDLFRQAKTRERNK